MNFGKEFEEIDRQARFTAKMARLKKERAEETEWQRQQAIDASLMPGVSKGQPFFLFHEETGCPAHLGTRYNELLQQHAQNAKQQRNRDSEFLRGFMSE